jgi:transcription antitermination factor NusG
MNNGLQLVAVISGPAPAPYERMLPWYALRTRPRWEKLVSEALRGKGYHDFLPTYTVRNRWSDRLKRVEVPLFPGYVFCRLDVVRRLPILVTPGVIDIVGLGKIPEPIPDREIEAIQTIARAGAPAVPWPYLRVGQTVRVTRGALRDMEGILITVKKEFRIVLSVDMLQRSVAVEVDRDCIEPKDFYATSKTAV